MAKVAFVLPFYNEEAVIELFHQKLVEATEKRSDLTFEFIYVNDGSKDKSYELLLALRENDSRITLLDLARNFGHEIANTAGLDLAYKVEADATVLMDTDLQDPPEVAMAMVEEWEKGVDVVYGQRQKRHSESYFSRVRAKGFYWLLARLSETDIPPDTSDFRVIDKKVLENVVKYRERDRFLRGIISDVGFVQKPYLFERANRAAGETHYNFFSLLSLAKTAIFGFSTVPLKAITVLGVFLASVSVLCGLAFTGYKIYDPTFSIPGWTFVVVLILFLSGCQTFMLGIIGSYIGRTYVEVLDRPLYSCNALARGLQEEVQNVDEQLLTDLES